jgi:hypothetical protein
MALMRVKSPLVILLVTVLAAGISADPAFGKKGGKGGGNGGGNGGGGDDSTADPPALPPFSYAVDVVPVEGLDRLNAVNDFGQCAATVDVSSVSDSIETVEDRAAVLIDTATGQVSYLDNLIDSSEPWDLYHALAVNNQGQIVGTGVKDGNYVARAYLLNPRSDESGYDVVDLGVDGTASWAREISQAGDVLLRVDDSWMVVISDGSVSPLPSADRSYWGIKSLGMLLGGYLVDGSAAALTGEMLYSDFSGTAETLELLPYMTGAGSPVLSESGFSFGKQRGEYQKIKGKEVGGTRVVTYDPLGSATEVSLGFNINANFEISDQVVDGVPLIAGTVGTADSDVFGKPWIRFPGYEAVVISDLMDDTELAALQSLSLGSGPSNGESDGDFMIATPRDETGAVLDNGAPTLYGVAFQFDEADGVAYRGIYLLSPNARE